MKKIGLIVFLTLLVFGSVLAINFFNGCERTKPLKIALSKGKGSEHYEAYSAWFGKFESNAQYVDLYHMPLSKALKELESCSGLVLTGGPDVSPYRYGKGDEIEKCEVDLKRDSLEFALIKKALELKIPILGICRGCQILNVAFGGSLIPDIPSDYQSEILHRMDNPDSCFHGVRLNKNTGFYSITKIDSGFVNSNHHQAIAQLASGFRSTAAATDGIIEAIEWKDAHNSQTVFAVQWHPERMDTSSAFSAPIARYFLSKVKFFHNN